MTDSSSDLQFLKDVYALARNKYKPARIRTLFLTEAPPDNLERYFYFEDVKKQDSLFLEVMGVLYPDLKNRYLRSGRKSDLKEDLLLQFQSDGYWMMTIAEIPFSLSSNSLQDYLPALPERLNKYINRQTPVILIQAAVYDLCYPFLAGHGYNVVNERIPFPGSGQQKIFREKFAQTLGTA
jgi:hypothetical protein